MGDVEAASMMKMTLTGPVVVLCLMLSATGLPTLKPFDMHCIIFGSLSRPHAIPSGKNYTLDYCFLVLRLC
jgi:hypothetical protein